MENPGRRDEAGRDNTGHTPRQPCANPVNQLPWVLTFCPETEVVRGCDWEAAAELGLGLEPFEPRVGALGSGAEKDS